AEALRQWLDAPADRVSVKWRRSPAPESGAIHVVSLILPTDYLRLAPPESTYKKPVLIIDAASPGKAIEFGFFFTREPEATVEAKFRQIGMPLVRTALITARRFGLSPVRQSLIGRPFRQRIGGQRASASMTARHSSPKAWR